MVGFVVKPCQDNPKNALHKSSDTQIDIGLTNTDLKTVFINTTKKTINYLGNLLRIAWSIFLKIAVLIEFLLMPVAAAYLLNKGTDTGKLLQNISEQLKTNGLENDVASYVLNSFPWPTYYMMATEVVFLIYVWAISYIKLKYKLDRVNIFAGNFINGLAFCSWTSLVLADTRLISLDLVLDYSFHAYLYVMVFPQLVCGMLINIQVKDLRKSQLGIHDPRTFLEKIYDCCLSKKNEADSKLWDVDIGHIRKPGHSDVPMTFRDWVLCFCFLIQLPLSWFYLLLQKSKFREIKAEISKDVDDLLETDVASNVVSSCLGICEYLIVTNFMFLGYLRLFMKFLEQTKSFIIRTHVVTITLIKWMTICCAFFLLILHGNLLAFGYIDLKTNFTDWVYITFLQLCLCLSMHSLLNFVCDLKRLNFGIRKVTV